MAFYVRLCARMRGGPDPVTPLEWTAICTPGAIVPIINANIHTHPQYHLGVFAEKVSFNGGRRALHLTLPPWSVHPASSESFPRHAVKEKALDTMSPLVFVKYTYRRYLHWSHHWYEWDGAVFSCRDSVDLSVNRPVSEQTIQCWYTCQWRCSENSALTSATLCVRSPPPPPPLWGHHPVCVVGVVSRHTSRQPVFIQHPWIRHLKFGNGVTAHYEYTHYTGVAGPYTTCSGHDRDYLIHGGTLWDLM